MESTLPDVQYVLRPNIIELGPDTLISICSRQRVWKTPPEPSLKKGHGVRVGAPRPAKGMTTGVWFEE